MFCMSCGAQNSDSSQFCAKCGKPLSNQSPAGAAQQQPASQPVPQPAAAGAQVQQPVAAGAQVQQPVPTAAAASPSASSAPSVNQAPPAQPVPGPSAGIPPVPAPEGVIGAAWKDITNSPGWLKHVLMLCLIGCVPIMNFAVDGYCIRWARELSFGKRESLPKTLFKKKEISTGFFAFLVRFAMGFALGLVTFAGSSLISGLFSIPSATAGLVISVILSILVFLFTLLCYNPCVDASVMRMSVVGYLESGFNFKDVWTAFRRNMGGLMGASILPRLIVGLVSGIVIGIIVAIMLAISGAISEAARQGMSNGYIPYIPSYYGSHSLAGLDGIAGMLTGAATIIIFFIVLLFVISGMFNVLATLLTYRAIGHWVARTAPEWASESDEGLDLDESGSGVVF